jgi:hypothetical protein
LKEFHVGNFLPNAGKVLVGESRRINAMKETAVARKPAPLAGVKRKINEIIVRSCNASPDALDAQIIKEYNQMPVGLVSKLAYHTSFFISRHARLSR